MDQVVKAMLLANTFNSYFNSKLSQGTSVATEFTPSCMQINIITTQPPAKNIIEVPLPYTEKGITYIEQNKVKRAVGKYLLIDKEKETMLDYMDIITSMFCDESNEVTSYFRKGFNFMQKIATGIRVNNVAISCASIQRTINAVVNKLPLYETPMHAWAMNHRVILIDSEFDSMAIPQKRLDYQVAKSKKYFSKGWTSIGLSDGVLADNNYILSTTLRSTVPFGFHHHNPQRNLYQTLNMVGDELPLIRSNRMESLSKEGITRTGWNLFTAFIDLPDNWEDQIIVSKRVAEKFVVRERKIQGFGTILVKEGQRIHRGTPLFINKLGEKVVFSTFSDEATVKSIKEEPIKLEGTIESGYTVIIALKRYIKEGTKITNLSANKGVVTIVEDLGYAIHPISLEKRNIDVIVSCRAIEKRKNFAQLLEALFNNLSEEKGMVIDDFARYELSTLESLLEEKGFPKEGTMECHTYKGVFKGVAGKIFWGVTKDVEDKTWGPTDTTMCSRGRRVAGLKFSTVELRAIETRFGKNNPLNKEILSYSQGADDIHEMMEVLKTAKGEVPANKVKVSYKSINPVQQERGVLLEKEQIVNTVVDDSFMPDGFLLELPTQFQIIVDANNEILYSGAPLSEFVTLESEERRYIIDKVYIPHSNLRKCWKHGSGKYGLSSFGVLANSLLTLCHKYNNNPEDVTILTLLYKSISNYFDKTSKLLGSKTGVVSVYGMSVRYPFSVKGVATLSTGLPKNTIQIHEHHAKELDVKEGDIVLVERFPCLGFMSIRPQKVTISKDPQNFYTIRVSGNSLGSLSLDFDGDDLYVAAFHSKEAKDCLNKEWANPNKSCYKHIKTHNEKMGKPHIACLSLQDYKLHTFDLLTSEEHASVVEKLTGVKSNTGPVVAMAYNIMRIVENSVVKDNQKVNIAVEVFLDKVANSVFKQKHGKTSLHQIVTDAICIGDVKALVNEGFDESTSITICDLIKEKAALIGVKDLIKYREFTEVPIISKIVRAQNKVYFSSRSSLSAIKMVDLLTAPAVDIPSNTFKYVLGAKDKTFSNHLEQRKKEFLSRQLYTDTSKELFTVYNELLESMLN